MGVALLDSSAVIGYLDRDDALHEAAVAAIETTVRAGAPLAISAVTLAELLHRAHLGHHDESAVRELIEDFGVNILPVDADVAERAAKLQAACAKAARRRGPRKLRTPDALILATACLYDDIDKVTAGDDGWRGVPGVTVDVELLRPRRGG
jgi:predicted nucleic acid-binding protein